MIDERPPIVDELIAGPYPCCLTTLGRHGNPYGVVVWCGRIEDAIGVNAAEGVWLGNLRRDPRASLVIIDTENILRHVAIRGRAVAISPDDDYAHIDSLSRVYEGRPYAYSKPEEVPRFRVVFEIETIRSLDLSPPR